MSSTTGPAAAGVEGLHSADFDVLHSVLQALSQLGFDASAAEQVALLRTLRWLGESAAERRLRNVVL